MAFELLQRGETKGVFQLESSGIRDLLVKMKPDRFADIIAVNALYRPGPLNGGMVDEYVDVKNGRKHATYIHPVLKEVLEETYGVMVYQEQVMRILNRLGGIELSKAYATIKAISKKKADTIAESRGQFVEGAIERGLDREKALKIFDLIEYFGGYGFNKSHSTAYALVAYQTAYLKSHYPTEYMAAVLSSEMDGAERDKFFVEHIDDCRRMGIEVLPPNVNEGGVAFRVGKEGQIHFGLGAIKGVGVKAVEAIVKAAPADGTLQEPGRFLRARLDPRSGQRLCRDLDPRRGVRFSRCPAVRNSWRSCHAQSRGARPSRTTAAVGSVGFSTTWRRAVGVGSNGHGNGKGQGPGHDPAAANLPDVPELADAELLGGEKKALGFYMSSHPLTRHAGLLQTLATHRAIDLAGLPDKTEVILGGMITSVQVRNVQKSRSGLTRMAKLSFEDLTGSTPAMLWPEEYAKLGELVKNDQIGFVKGTLDRRREPAELIISKIMPIETAAAELARGVVVRLHKGVHQEADLERLLRFVRVRPGHLDLFLEIVGIEHVRRAVYKAGASLRIRYNERLTAEMEEVVGSGNVRLLGQRGATTRVDSMRRSSASSQPAKTLAAEIEIDDTSSEEMDED